MTIITKNDGFVVTIEEINIHKYNVTIQPNNKVSVTMNGLKTLEDCLRYAEIVKNNFKSGE